MTVAFPGPEVIKLEFSLELKIKSNDWLLVDTCSFFVDYLINSKGIIGYILLIFEVEKSLLHHNYSSIEHLRLYM